MAGFEVFTEAGIDHRDFVCTGSILLHVRFQLRDHLIRLFNLAGPGLCIAYLFPIAGHAKFVESLLIIAFLNIDGAQVPMQRGTIWGHQV